MQQKSNLLNEKEENKQNNSRIFFKLLEKVGAFGKYQIMTIALWSVIMYLNGGLMFMTPFLFFEDPYICPQIPIQGECKKYVCGLAEFERQFFLPQKSIFSLANHFGDYRCPSEKLSFDTLISVMFFGAAMGFLCLTLFGEVVGRKLLMQINMGSFVLGIGLLTFCIDLYMAAAGLFFAVLGISNAYITCFYFIIQCVSDQYREKMSVVCQAFYGVGVILDILWYWAIGDWQIIMGACFLVPGILVLVVLTFFVKDTPSCLVLQNDSETAFKAFLEIASINGVQSDLQEEEIIDAREHFDFSLQKSNLQKFTVVDLFKYKSTRLTTILLIILFCIICFAFYAPSLMLSQFELDLYVNGLAIGLSQIVAYTGSFFIIEKFRRKIIAYVCFGLTGISALILTFLWDQNGDSEITPGQQAGILILIFVFELAISAEFTIFYVYQNQVYPTQARVIGTSIVSLVGQTVVIFGSTIIDFFFEKELPIMVLFAVILALCLLIKSQMPETFQKMPEELIFQFREKSSQYRSKISTKKDLLTSALSRNLLPSP